VIVNVNIDAHNDPVNAREVYQRRWIDNVLDRSS
jgi:hypothetical protein